MTTNLHSPKKNQTEGKHNLFIEVSSKEKQLVMLIHAKGLLNTDVQELYRKVRSGYEKIILSDNEMSELQDIEYCLWKLHYKHIDEFRKRTKRNSTSENTKPVEQHNSNYLEGFKLFLSEATEFYQNLIKKIREHYGLLDGRSCPRRGCISKTLESKKTIICQFLCHRFLVCLGDLARYREQYENLDIQNHSWSVAATHYMEATEIWPDSGNPQNQLAVLATYVGDEFLALYHCIRSLAVKEPFPDAHDNLIVLLERNRSSLSPSLSSEAQFNFLKPSERCIIKTNSKSSDVSSLGNALKAKNSCSTETDVWSLFIKLISFFFIKSSFDDIPFAFTSIMGELDALMALDDKELKTSLESYQNMDFVKTGPYRALQVVSIFLYTLENLINSPQTKDFEDTNGTQLIGHRNWALLSTFVFMGRFVDRCLKAVTSNSCPLLPAVLVFVEWLANRFHEAEKYRVDYKCRAAMSYFFYSFDDLLKRVGFDKSTGDSSDKSPLWEDYELRGFTPVTCAQESLAFSSHWERMDNFEEGSESRVSRLINAGRIFYDQSRGKFFNPYVVEFNQILKGKEPEKAKPIDNNLKTDACDKKLQEDVRESGLQILRVNPKTDGNALTTEDEEVILFNPLTRCHSASVCSNSKDMEDPTIPPDDFLRHATSLLIAQNQAQGCDPSGVISNFRDYKSFKQQERNFRDAAAVAHPSQHSQPISAGPPSLSAWVIDGGNLIAKERAPGGVSPNANHVLGPIEEVASEPLYSLSITEKEDSTVGADSSPTKHHASSPYSAPAPSAPLLPEDAAWYTGLQPSFNKCKTSEVESTISRTETLCSMPSQSAVSSSARHPNWTPVQAPTEYTLGSIPGPTLIHPTQRQMTSSEWLRHYLQTHNNLVDRSYNNHSWPWPWPSYYYATTGSPGRSNPLTSSATIQAETPPLYTTLPHDYSSVADVQRRDKLLYGYQRPGPYMCGAVQDVMISEPQPLLQYLKERERQLQAHDAGPPS